MLTFSGLSEAQTPVPSATPLTNLYNLYDDPQSAPGYTAILDQLRRFCVEAPQRIQARLDVHWPINLSVHTVNIEPDLTYTIIVNQTLWPNQDPYQPIQERVELDHVTSVNVAQQLQSIEDLVVARREAATTRHHEEETDYPDIYTEPQNNLAALARSRANRLHVGAGLAFPGYFNFWMQVPPAVTNNSASLAGSSPTYIETQWVHFQLRVEAASDPRYTSTTSSPPWQYALRIVSTAYTRRRIWAGRGGLYYALGTVEGALHFVQPDIQGSVDLHLAEIGIHLRQRITQSSRLRVILAASAQAGMSIFRDQGASLAPHFGGNALVGLTLPDTFYLTTDGTYQAHRGVVFNARLGFYFNSRVRIEGGPTYTYRMANPLVPAAEPDSSFLLPEDWTVHVGLITDLNF